MCFTKPVRTNEFTHGSRGGIYGAARNQLINKMNEIEVNREN